MKLYCRALASDNPSHRRLLTCDGNLGESPHDVVFYAVTRHRTPRKSIESPAKDVRRCPKCGWWNIFVTTDYIPTNGLARKR